MALCTALKLLHYLRLTKASPRREHHHRVTIEANSPDTQDPFARIQRRWNQRPKSEGAMIHVSQMSQHYPKDILTPHPSMPATFSMQREFGLMDAGRPEVVAFEPLAAPLAAGAAVVDAAEARPTMPELAAKKAADLMVTEWYYARRLAIDESLGEAGSTTTTRRLRRWRQAGDRESSKSRY